MAASCSLASRWRSCQVWMVAQNALWVKDCTSLNRLLTGELRISSIMIRSASGWVSTDCVLISCSSYTHSVRALPELVKGSREETWHAPAADHVGSGDERQGRFGSIRSLSLAQVHNDRDQQRPCHARSSAEPISVPLHCQCLTRSQGTVLVSDTRSLLV